MYKKSSSGWAKHLDFILLDLFSMFASFQIGFFFWFKVIIQQAMPAKSVQNGALIGLLLVTLLVCILGDPHKNIINRGYLVEANEVLRQRITVLAGFAVYLVATQANEGLSRGTVAVIFVLDCLLGYTLHIIRKNMVRKKLQKSSDGIQMLVICEKEDVDDILVRMQTRKYSGFKVSGLIITDEDRKGESIRGVPVVCNVSEAEEYVVGAVVDEVFLSTRNDQLKDGITDYLLEAGVSVHINMMAEKRYHTNTAVEYVAGYSVLTISNNSVSDWQLLCKRAMDIAGGLVGCLLCGIVYIYVAPRIKKADPGPVFFTQERIGKNGRRFKIHKFRSMYMDAEKRKAELMAQNKMEGLMFKVDDDPRILPGIGRIIREKSLDEFPQFWDVLRGDMSLVGTRPPTVDEFVKYATHHKSRLSFKPGITGMWQVSGRSNITDFEEIVRLDNNYIQNWNLRLDIKILIKTVLVVFKKQGAE